jgi:hypothetical protein
LQSRIEGRQAVGRIAYCGKAEVALALGCSRDFVEDHVWADLKKVRRGRLVFCSVSELENWLERNAERDLS